MFRGIKILRVFDNYVIGSKGYTLLRIDNEKGNMSQYSRIKDIRYSLLSKNKLLRRFFRAEITNLYSLPDGTEFCIAKKGIFVRNLGKPYFTKSFHVRRGSRPLNLCIDCDNTVYFGEYFANKENQSINIYSSNDKGITWNVVYTFGKGNINHIHGVFKDIYSSQLWVITGDRENECIIGYSPDKFHSFIEVFRGGQMYRTCNLFFYKDFIVFATDSQYMKNTIMCFDRKTLNITHIEDIQGSSIKGGQVGNISFLSTTVEPSQINKSNFSYIWITHDGKIWENIYKSEKDLFPSIFQFGCFEFPSYCISSKLGKLYYTGRALKDIDGNSNYIEI